MFLLVDSNYIAIFTFSPTQHRRERTVEWMAWDRADRSIKYKWSL